MTVIWLCHITVIWLCHMTVIWLCHLTCVNVQYFDHLLRRLLSDNAILALNGGAKVRTNRGLRTSLRTSAVVQDGSDSREALGEEGGCCDGRDSMCVRHSYLTLVNMRYVQLRTFN